MRGVRATLWGPDHVELGQTATAVAGPRAALALSRGEHVKRYAYTDPNEDVVAAVAGPRATLLVCADGHSGAAAPVAAVRSVLADVGDDPPAGLDRRAWTELFARANDRCLQAAVDRGQPSSSTVLMAALCTSERVSWASMGDAALVVTAAGAARGRQLNRERMRFVGHPMRPRALRDALDAGEHALGPHDWVVLATDGLSEFIGPLRPADVVPRVLARAVADGGTPEDAAAALVAAAGAAGAGDNVGIALLSP